MPAYRLSERDGTKHTCDTGQTRNKLAERQPEDQHAHPAAVLLGAGDRISGGHHQVAAAHHPSVMARADLGAARRRMRAELQDESFTKIELRGALRGVRPLRRTLMRGAAGRGIGPAGAAAIAEALKINKTVTTIYLDCALCAARVRAEC